MFNKNKRCQIGDSDKLHIFSQLLKHIQVFTSSRSMRFYAFLYLLFVFFTNKFPVYQYVCLPEVITWMLAILPSSVAVSSHSWTFFLMSGNTVLLIALSSWFCLIWTLRIFSITWRSFNEACLSQSAAKLATWGCRVVFNICSIPDFASVLLSANYTERKHITLLYSFFE